MTDNELIESLKESSGDLDVLYKNHKDYCMNFMNKKSFNTELNKEIYQRAVMICYENILKGFELKNNSTLQTYLTGICKNLVFDRLKKENKHIEYSEEFDNRIDDFDNFYEFDLPENTPRMQAILKALEIFKDLGGRCYEILHKYFFENKSMDKIAYEMDYTNGANVKNQKSRCQKQFKEQVFKLLNN